VLLREAYSLIAQLTRASGVHENALWHQLERSPVPEPPTSCIVLEHPRSDSLGLWRCELKSGLDERRAEAERPDFWSNVKAEELGNARIISPPDGDHSDDPEAESFRNKYIDAGCREPSLPRRGQRGDGQRTIKDVDVPDFRGPVMDGSDVQHVPPHARSDGDFHNWILRYIRGSTGTWSAEH
jgi:hypothetical protein